MRRLRRKIKMCLKDEKEGITLSRNFTFPNRFLIVDSILDAENACNNVQKKIFFFFLEKFSFTIVEYFYYREFIDYRLIFSSSDNGGL